MTSINKNKYFLLSMIWLFLLTFLTVFKHAPQWLNADVLINSVMSLQKLTLFYWGQNRLLNILPATTALVRNPEVNLALVLLIASFFFYLYLYFVARFAAFLVNSSKQKFLSLQIFVVTSAFFLIAFNSKAIFEIAIWHIEYSFPALCLSLSVYLFFLHKKHFIWCFFFSIALIILAIGVNPSIIIPVVFVFCAVIFYNRKVKIAEIIVIFSSLVVFFVWDYISKNYGDLNYNNFDFNILIIGLEKVFNGLLTVFNLIILLIFFGFWACIKLLTLNNRNGQNYDSYKLSNYVIYIIFIFSIFWFFIFSSSGWVAINQFSWRYFTFIIFGFLWVVAIEIAKVFNEVKIKIAIILTFIFGLVAVGVAFALPPSFDKYKIIQRVNKLSIPNSNLYAGDYWDVWPSVLRDMMKGYEAYGLTYRGEANKDNAKKYVFEKIKKDGYAIVTCLNDDPINCINQINYMVGPIYVSEATNLNDKVHKIKIKIIDFAPGLDYEKEVVSNLPSNVGSVVNNSKLSDGRAGYLVFGPYVPFKAGRYKLTVFGASEELNGAYIEIVSAKGEMVYEKLILPKYVEGSLLENVLINIPENTVDLEVRVWVNQGDELMLSGYKLELVSGFK